MINKKIKDTNYLTFENLSKYKNLINFVSTRMSGDMAYKEEKPEQYIENRRKFLNSFDIELGNTVFCEQVHKERVEVVNNKFIENRSGSLNIASQADGLITETPGICLAIRTSDCVPIIIFDPTKNILGVAHAGWRGTYVQIAKRTVEKMQQVFGCDPKELVAGIGPSIGPKDFFVMQDVYQKFADAGYSKQLQFVSDNQWLLDLWGINKIQLCEAGILSNNIEISDISTYTSDKLFSYRKKDPEGHFITGAMLVN